MTTKTNTPTLKTATKAPAKSVPAKASPAKAPTRKAPVKQAPSNEAIIMDTLRGLNARVEALETANSLNEVRITEAFENMTKVIASLQVTLANMHVPASRVTNADRDVFEAAGYPTDRKPAAKKAPATRDNGERGTYDGPDVSGPADDVLAYLAECVIENANAGFLNENVAKASPNSYRRYLRTAQNKAFKACREAHDLTLTQMDDAFTALFA